MSTQSSVPSSMGSSDDTCSSSSTLSSNECIDVPSHWRPEVEEGIKRGSLSDTARPEIVRVLVNQLFVRGKPSRIDCEQHARRLILKYPFMKDDMGNGYVSQGMGIARWG